MLNYQCVCFGPFTEVFLEAATHDFLVGHVTPFVHNAKFELFVFVNRGAGQLHNGYSGGLRCCTINSVVYLSY
jgi:hypothetical protein